MDDYTSHLCFVSFIYLICQKDRVATKTNCIIKNLSKTYTVGQNFGKLTVK